MRSLWGRLPILLLLSLSLVGCARPAAWQQSYVLRAPASMGSPARPPATPAGVLRLASVLAPNWLMSTDYVYRLNYTDPEALLPYPKVRWAATPGQMLGDLLLQCLREQEAWQAVLNADQSGRPDLLLQLNLQRFQLDYSAPNAGQAQIQATATLVQNGSFRVLAQQEFQSSVPLRQMGPAGGAAAMSTAAQDLTSEVAQWAAQKSRVPVS